MYWKCLLRFVGMMVPIFTARNSSCGKVMYSQVSLSDSVHKGRCVCLEGWVSQMGRGENSRGYIYGVSIPVVSMPTRGDYVQKVWVCPGERAPTPSGHGTCQRGWVLTPCPAANATKTRTIGKRASLLECFLLESIWWWHYAVAVALWMILDCANLYLMVCITTSPYWNSL